MQRYQPGSLYAPGGQNNSDIVDRKNILINIFGGHQ